MLQSKLRRREKSSRKKDTPPCRRLLGPELRSVASICLLPHGYLFLGHIVHGGRGSPAAGLGWCVYYTLTFMMQVAHKGPSSAHSDLLPSTVKPWHLHCFPYLIVLKSEIMV